MNNSGNQSSLPQPTCLGLRASFGFGDRLGVATPGHIAACRRGRLLPIFAQQSVREMSRTGRTPAEVLRAAQQAVQQRGYQGVWGADADHLKTREDVEHLAAAGFTFFTIDPSAQVHNEADRLRGNDLRGAAERAAEESGWENLNALESVYLGKTFDLGQEEPIGFAEREPLYRAVVKYGRAMAYAELMSRWIRQATPSGGAEIELSVDETETPTVPLEHLFIGLELKRRAIPAVSVAPRFVGEFEKGIDYRGDLGLFESTLCRHVAIARFCGPYKISVHSGSDKFRIYPVIGRVCGELLHVKTAGTSYLEALRVVARQDPALFREIVGFARTRYQVDRASYHVSAVVDQVPLPLGGPAQEWEAAYLEREDGRQVLHVTFGSVLSAGQTASGRPFKEAVLESLERNASLHEQVLADHLGRHLALLSAG